MRLNKKGALLLSPDEKKILSRLPKETYDLIVRCVTDRIIQSLMFEMSVDDEGRIIFTPKVYPSINVEPKTN